MSDTDSIVDLGVVAGTPAAAPGRVRAATRKAPRWLWAAALVVVAPVSIAVLGLFLRAIGSSSTVLDTLITARTLRLAGRSFPVPYTHLTLPTNYPV